MFKFLKIYIFLDNVVEHGGEGHGHGHQSDECPSYDIISKCYQNVTGYYD